MKRYELNGSWYSVNELSEMSGIAAHTLRDRIRRGYSIDQAIKPTAIMESVEKFSEASWWNDWIDQPTDSVYNIYWKWCISHEYPPASKQVFLRQLFQLYPMLKSVPMRGVRYVRQTKARI